MSKNDESSESQIPSIQIITLGEAGVGKTSLILRYAENKFSEQYLNTVGVDFKTKKVNVDGDDVVLKIWDTAGQEKFRSISRSFIGRADGIFIVFDVSARSTFNKVQEWINSIKDAGNNHVVIVLIGNKCDIERSVSSGEAKVFAYDRNIAYYDTSAKDGTNIEEVFLYMAKNCKTNKPVKEPVPQDNSQKSCKC
ncbi:hypothetical protein M9Y10_018927 [Tritrichomonas musculus]|uniref:Uncharacterized protein n=1 Tax=Tritrichomonas musculus TaxID=1915356 RepID=A0ABR2HK14_9EUKA